MYNNHIINLIFTTMTILLFIKSIVLLLAILITISAINKTITNIIYYNKTLTSFEGFDVGKNYINIIPMSAGIGAMLFIIFYMLTKI